MIIVITITVMTHNLSVQLQPNENNQTWVKGWAVINSFREMTKTVGGVFFCL